MTRIEGVDAVGKRYDDVHKKTPMRPFTKSPTYEYWHQRVVQSDNDFIVVVAAASKSAMSGVGKTTLAIALARWFDRSTRGFEAETKSTVSAQRFARDLLADDEEVQDQSAIIFDEGQGTLNSGGADARRSMAQSVMDVTTALSTMRFRQLTSIIVTQSTDWIDKRVDQVMDIMILIQDSTGGTIRAEVFETYYNDLDADNTRYVEHLDTITWPDLGEDDPDYRYLHKLKEDSATGDLPGGEEEEDQELPKEKQIALAQYRRDQGDIAQEIADHPMIEYGKDWVYKHTEASE